MKGSVSTEAIQIVILSAALLLTLLLSCLRGSC